MSREIPDVPGVTLTVGIGMWAGFPCQELKDALLARGTIHPEDGSRHLVQTALDKWITF